MRAGAGTMSSSRANRNQEPDMTRHQDEPTDLDAMLELMADATRDRDEVSLRDVMQTIGYRSFGPLLLLAGLITLAPLLGDIPGMATMMGLLVLLTAGQLLFGRRHVWLPRWLLDRSVTSDSLNRAIAWLRRPARFIDRLLRPRLTGLVQGVGIYLVALTCMTITFMTPAMEVIPFSANAAGLVWAAFGLALISRDGLISLVALVVAVATGGVIAYNLL